MPSVSKAQQKAAGLALAAKRKEIDSSTLKGAAKEMYDSMSEKQLKEYAGTKHKNLPERKEEETMLDDNILTEIQKQELRKIIDSLVEERVQQRNKQFVDKYTKFIVESASTKLVDKVKNNLMKRFDEEIKSLKNKTEKICRSVISESSSKVVEMKNKQKELVENFKKTAPELIKNLAEDKAKELAADALQAISENEKLSQVLNSITKGMEKAGFVINEDVDNAIQKIENEKRMLRTKLANSQRENKFFQLTEGLLPKQTKALKKLLEDCTTAEMLEDRFLAAKKKVLETNMIVEDEVSQEVKDKKESTQKVFQEEENFTQFLSAAKAAI